MKNSVDFWHRKLTLKLQFWHFLRPWHYVNLQNTAIPFEYSWFLSKNLAFYDPSSEKLHDLTDINVCQAVIMFASWWQFKPLDHPAIECNNQIINVLLGLKKWSYHNSKSETLSTRTCENRRWKIHGKTNQRSCISRWVSSTSFLFFLLSTSSIQSSMTAWVESTFLNPVELLISLSFQNIMIWCVT